MKDPKKTKEKIIALYETKKFVHPSYQEIADEVGVGKSYVHKVIQLYKLQNQAFGIKKN